MSVKANGNVPEKLGSAASEKNKWHLDCLLEKLKQQQQNKTFQELSKSVRMSLLEKRYAMDAIEKANLQKTLDNLQQYIQVKNVTRTWLVERLESLSRQLGLKFNIDNGLFISSDMFYIEINLNSDDTVKEVNVHHEGAKEHYPCKELVTAISKGDFIDLTAQLEGLISIYQINAEKAVKCKAFVALQALETDLAHFSLLQASMTKDNYQMCMHSPLGLLQKRRGGHPMQITYFVSAYDLIDPDRKQLVSSLTNDLINTKKIGSSVTVNLEASASTRLQIQPLLLINTDGQGCTTSAYSQMNQNNSMLLPATFVLRLNKPSAVGCQIVQEIERITEQKLANQTAVPLMALIVSNASDGKITNIDRSMFVSLPDQNHCYFLSEMKEQAIQVTNIPFSDPQQVPKVIRLLRQQALFNTLISSCVRSNNSAPKDLESLQMFEITALSSQYITVALEHPYQQQLTTIEFDLSDMGNIGCNIYGGTQIGNISNKIAKVIQTCMSIPVTMRYLLKSWHQEYARVNLRKFDSDNYNMSLGSNDPGVEDDEYDPLAPNSNDNDYSQQGRYLNSNEQQMSGGNASDRIAEAMEKICGKPIKMEEDDDIFDESNDSFSLAGALDNPASASSYDFDPKEVLEGPPPKKMKTEISITPIGGSQFGQNVTLERRGIEIIPISSANAKDLPASITITPINNSSKSSSEKRSSSGSSDGKSEKKKKRKREENSQMGPPDPLSKPLHHLASGSSPIHRTSSGGSSSSSAKQSPKHSPVHAASPKHQSFASSPKHSISSPKHSSGGASSGGKPSMSLMKSAANSPKSLSLATSPSLTSAANAAALVAAAAGENGQAKNRKGSLTNIIDKLKSNAQTDDIFQFSAQSSSPSLASSASSTSNTTQSNTSNNAQNTSSSISSSNSGNSSSNTSSAPNQSCTSTNKPSSEYMVKHSSDGMKITINKTKSKDKSSSGLTKSASFTSGSSSPKIHTGLKPGVNSGPASKKPSISSSSKSSSGMSGIQKLPFQKSSSSGNLSSTSSSSSSGKVYSPSKSSSGSSKDKSSSKSKSSSSSGGISGSSSDKYRPDATDIMKMLGFSTSGQAENFMKSSKFQIPKISARASGTSSGGGSQSSSNSSGGVEDYRKEKSNTSHSAPNTPSTNTPVDFASKILGDFNKYPMSYSAASKLPGDISPMHVPSAAASLNKISVGSSPKYNTQADTREAMNLETYHSQKLNSMGLNFQGGMHQGMTAESLQEKAMESMKQQQQQQRSNTPSHSVHATVVKSPSPLIIIPSPRSNEHMADDDNLMEELVAITK
ncbi:mediator of RNA polymerase II transcription subunit 1-like isoform X1 [Culicoides brevitarsis]|uniref:mediator of RNA polymerase II transcription subunit 1-like isoform X1 n=1 Tax=Culicoides brevitarsis TaxID=469753 RepID=UPI00307C54FA